MKIITEEMNDMTPTMYPMGIGVKNEIQKCVEIQNALIKSNLDDIVFLGQECFYIQFIIYLKN